MNANAAIPGSSMQNTPPTTPRTLAQKLLARAAGRRAVQTGEIVNCAIDLSGDIDLALPYPAAFDNALVRDYLGGSWEEVPDVYRDASPVTWVNAETVPFLVIHSANDEINPVAHARALVAALHEASVETVHVELGRGGHMATADWANSGPWVLTFLADRKYAAVAARAS